MGFQFNHVGGGTKTRRPITLHMKYNSACVQPVCFLVTEDAGEAELSLEELQVKAELERGERERKTCGPLAARCLLLPFCEHASRPLSLSLPPPPAHPHQEYIELENARLERDQQFWAKEIVVRVEYKYCPNLTIIDTPGLISAAPGRRNHGLQASSRAVEAMVRAKMEQREYIILCLEDTNDWSNATTRRLVMQVDPHLARTAVVSTKLDTRLPQFARGEDVELFLRPPARLLETGMLGGCPFFT